MATKRTKTVAKPQKQSRSPRQEKPVFGMGTWITLALFALLIAASYYLKNQKEIADAAATPASETILVFDTTALPSSIEIKPAGGDAVKIARNAENLWEIELPFKAEANQGTAEEAASQLASLSVV